jgi:hypothetical protein
MIQPQQQWVSLFSRRFTGIHATKLLVSCAFAVMTFAAPQALKATDTDGPCPLQNATLRGTYMVTSTGTIVGVGAVTAVGTITYDGKGNSVNTFTVSVNGTISRGVTVTGPYSVNRDCTGTLAQSDGSHYDFVVAPDGSTVFWIETDAGVVLSGTEVRLGHSSEFKESRNRNAVPPTSSITRQSTSPDPSGRSGVIVSLRAKQRS